MACQLAECSLDSVDPAGGDLLRTASLTSREKQVRALVMDGLSTDGVAVQLGISRRTVEAHLRNVYRKLGVHRRDELTDPSTGERELLEGALAAYEDEVRRLEEKLAARDLRIESYEAAIERIIDRQFPLFEECVELTVSIGSRSTEDMIVERHWTTPKPYLVYRVIRPIAARDIPYDALVGQMSVACEIAGADIGMAVEVFSDYRGRPVAIILFQPGLEARTEWVLRYRTPHLWDPLREQGRDTLNWTPGRLDGRSSASMNDFTVHFDFPSTVERPSIIEEHDFGHIEVDSTGRPSSVTRITYRDLSRARANYDFVLTLDRAE